jgi:polyhydroxyalkanoate synthase
MPDDPIQMFASLFKGGFGAMGALPGSSAEGGAADPMAGFAAFSKQMSEAQQLFMKQMTQVGEFWTAQAAAAGWPNPMAAMQPKTESSEDRRFAADAWRNDPRFDIVRRSYLAYADWLQNAVESAPVDGPTKAQMRYGMRQFVDAMSPSNFFVTNPEAMQLAFESGGQSVVQGMNLFFDDLAKGRVSSTDETAYEVGRDLAATPGAVVFENELIQLIQYAPTTPKVHERPLLMVPPCINKFYILDLQPENSLVGHAVATGNTVFMVSWRNVGPEQGQWTWDDYLTDGVMKAIDVALDISGADKVNALGFCVGGTLLASALAVMRATDVDKVASMTLLTTMLDFSDAGEIGSLVTPQSVEAREATIGGGGVMQGKELAFTFSSLRANDLIWQYVVNSYLKGKAPPAFDMLYWNADSTNLPGPMFCWYVRNTYLENNLRTPGKTTQCGTPVDLSLIDVPAFLYASREDHIVPWKTAYASTELLAGDITFVLGASGHIAGVINAPAKKKRNYWTNEKPVPDADAWLEAAQSVPGSWWPAWTDWLATHAGDDVPAPKSLGSRKYKRIENAPGRYVKQKDA